MAARIHPALRARSGAPSGPWDALARLLPPLPPGSLAACAFSGGVDSCAMLACAVLAYGPARVVAIHVNHGIQAAASSFEAFCRQRSALLGVHLIVASVDARPRGGASPEEAAREARMHALASHAVNLGSAFCLLAHHADDQAETLLLALSRGLGLGGLSGMGPDMVRHGARFVRPWLGASRLDIELAAREAQMDWTEDPTNEDTRFSRNLVRARVMPALSGALPQFKAASSRSMAHCAEALALLEEVARDDLAALRRSDALLDLRALRSLSPPRRSNLTRHWLRFVHGAYPTQAQMEEALLQIDASASGGSIDIKCGHGKIFRQGALLAFLDEPPHRPTVNA